MRMWKFSLKIIIIATMFLTPLYGYSQTTVNFDTDPVSNPIPDNTVINNTYSTQGVTFSCLGVSCNGSNVYAETTQPQYAVSDPNVISIFTFTPSITQSSGAIEARFNCPIPGQRVTSVSVQATGYYNNAAAFLSAYDSSDMQVAGSIYYMSSLETSQLIVSASDIEYVRFSGYSTFQGATFDDLVFTCAGQRIAAVPGMNQWGMMLFLVLAGFGGVYYLYRRKKNTVEY